MPGVCWSTSATAKPASPRWSPRCARAAWWWSKIPTGWCSTRKRCRTRSASYIARCADAYVASAGYDPNLGTRLPELLTDAGLVNVEAEGKVFMMYGGTPSMEWYVLGLERSLGTVVEMGIVSADLATAALAEARDPKCRLLSPLQMTAWGRKPG